MLPIAVSYITVVILVPLLVLMITLPFWVWMLIEVLTKEPADSDQRLAWVLVVLLAGPLGALIYFFARRPQRLAEEKGSRRSATIR